MSLSLLYYVLGDVCQSAGTFSQQRALLFAQLCWCRVAGTFKLSKPGDRRSTLACGVWVLRVASISPCVGSLGRWGAARDSPLAAGKHHTFRRATGLLPRCTHSPRGRATCAVMETGPRRCNGQQHKGKRRLWGDVRAVRESEQQHF